MENNYFGQFGTFGKAAAKSAKELETINAKVIEQLAQKNMDLFNSAIEMNNKFVSLIGEAKGVQDLMAEQLKLTSEYNGKVITTIQEAADIVVESKDDYQTWLEGGLQTVTDSAQTIVPTQKARPKKAA
jgi:hypothetical protein